MPDIVEGAGFHLTFVLINKKLLILTLSHTVDNKLFYRSYLRHFAEFLILYLHFSFPL